MRWWKDWQCFTTFHSLMFSWGTHQLQWIAHNAYTSTGSIVIIFISGIISPCLAAILADCITQKLATLFCFTFSTSNAWGHLREDVCFSHRIRQKCLRICVWNYFSLSREVCHEVRQQKPKAICCCQTLQYLNTYYMITIKLVTSDLSCWKATKWKQILKEKTVTFVLLNSSS